MSIFKPLLADLVNNLSRFGCK